jgi:CubicO group peptidase (beta-lactamase class C family)
MIGRRRFLEAASLGLLAPWADCALGADKDEFGESLPIDEQVVRVLAPARDGRRVPGMIGAIVSGGKLAAIGALGLRKVGSDRSMKAGDVVHLGSCTKAMTATMIGRLVDDGALGWETTLGDLFPDDAASLHPDCRTITLLQLLNHRSGLPENGPLGGRWGGLTTSEQRRAVMRMVLKEPPRTRPGTTYGYSNLGYALAALMAERASGSSWDELMRRLLFRPLEMTTAGFGPPGSPKGVNQPWGHRSEGGKVRATRQDNPAWMAPACMVHASVPDWARFAILHLQSANGQAHLLEPDTFRTLHTPPPGQDYAGGWFVPERSWAGGRALMHKGSNLSWFAILWLAPAHDLAFLVVANQGGSDGDAACEEALTGLVKSYFTTRPQRRRRRP